MANGGVLLYRQEREKKGLGVVKRKEEKKDGPKEPRKEKKRRKKKKKIQGKRTVWSKRTLPISVKTAQSSVPHRQDKKALQ
jgi:hypothetical protein